MGVYQQLYAALVTGYPVGFYAPKYPAAPVVPTPVNVIESCKAVGVTGIGIVPAFIEVGHLQISVDLLLTHSSVLGSIRRTYPISKDPQGTSKCTMN